MTNCTYTLKSFDNGDMLRYSLFLTATPMLLPYMFSRVDVSKQILPACPPLLHRPPVQLRHHHYHFPASRKGDVTRNVNFLYFLMVRKSDVTRNVSFLYPLLQRSERVMLPGTLTFFIPYCNGQAG